MNILYVDIDSLRPDHLGCYGYHRATSPHIDALAREGIRFDRCYTHDAPCLPSRTGMTTGRFGIHTGVVNHGGLACQPHLWGRERGFSCNMTDANWVNLFRNAGYHTVAFSPFAQRHGAWHWYAGFMEMHNTGSAGSETANEIAPQVTSWLKRKESQQPFFMWVNFWDPHTPYRTPRDFGNPFAKDPLPEWYGEPILMEHRQKAGPHSPQEVNGFVPRLGWMDGLARSYPAMDERQPDTLETLSDVRRMFDNYDTGVRYADRHLGHIIAALKSLGLYEDTVIIVSADHGENLGELWVYGDHQTADELTHHIPMIVRWPGKTESFAGQCDSRFMYSLDMAATALVWSGLAVPSCWDGQSFADAKHTLARCPHRDHVILSQLAWCAQRSARWEDYLLIETYHDAFHDYPERMLFNVKEDPHEQHDLAPSHPDLVQAGEARIAAWRTHALERATHPMDPRDTVLAEGGPFHCRDEGAEYLRRLSRTGRRSIAKRLAHKHQLLLS